MKLKQHVDLSNSAYDMRLKNSVTLKDALYNCSTDCTKTETFDGITGLNPTQVYGQGIINGMVAAFVSTGMDFAAALKLVTDYMPATFDKECMPKAWRTR